MAGVLWSEECCHLNDTFNCNKPAVPPWPSNKPFCSEALVPSNCFQSASLFVCVRARVCVCAHTFQSLPLLLWLRVSKCLCHNFHLLWLAINCAELAVPKFLVYHPACWIGAGSGFVFANKISRSFQLYECWLRFSTLHRPCTFSRPPWTQLGAHLCPITHKHTAQKSRKPSPFLIPERFAHGPLHLTVIQRRVYMWWCVQPYLEAESNNGSW